MRKRIGRSWLAPAVLVAALGFVQPAMAQYIPGGMLTLWLRADVGVTFGSGGGVSSWLDTSGDGHTAVNATASTQPAYVFSALNGYPVIRFNGSQSLFAGAITLPTWTIFVVGKNNNETGSSGEILGPGDLSNNQLRYENGTQILTYGSGNSMPIVTSTIGNDRVYQEFSVRYDGSTYEVDRDQVVVNTQPLSTSGSWVLGSIGAWFSSCPSCRLVGDIAEIIIYARALSDTERATVESYLSRKYALPVP